MIILSLTLALDPALTPPLLRVVSVLAGGFCNINFSIETQYLPPGPPGQPDWCWQLPPDVVLISPFLSAPPPSQLLHSVSSFLVSVFPLETQRWPGSLVRSVRRRNCQIFYCNELRLRLRSIEQYLDCRVLIRSQPWVLPVSGSPPGGPVCSDQTGHQSQHHQQHGHPLASHAALRHSDQWSQPVLTQTWLNMLISADASMTNTLKLRIINYFVFYL